MIFDFDNTFFIHFFLFIIILIIFNKLYVTPFLELKKKRRKATLEKITRAEELFLKATVIEKECDTVIEAAKTLALQNKKEGWLLAVIKSDKMRLVANKKANEQLEQSEKEILNQAKAFKQSVKSQTNDLAIDLSRKLLGRN